MLSSLLSSLVFDFKFRRAKGILKRSSNMRSTLQESADSDEGTLLRLKSKSDVCALDLCSDLGDADFSTVSAVLKRRLLNFQFLNGLGRGGFGCVFMAQLAGDAPQTILAVKIEAWYHDKGSDSPLSREARLYIEHGRSTRDDVPLPKVCNAFSRVGGAPRDCWASISLGSERTVNLLCMELLDTETPIKIWKEAAKQLDDNLEVTASLRYLILEALHAQLYLVQKGIAHRDLKWPYHLAKRMDGGQLVILDHGMAEQKGRAYDSKVGYKRSRHKNTGAAEPIITTCCPRAPAADTSQHRFGGDLPGTHGFRAPFKAETLEGGHYTDIWAAGASITRLFRRHRQIGIQFEEQLHAVVQRQDFEEFLNFALEGKDRTQMKDSCRRLLRLAYQMFQSTPFDGRTCRPPDKVIINALFSEFSLCYIYEEHELERKLCAEGIVIDGKIHSDTRIQRPVLLIKHGLLGLLLLTIFRSGIGDPACEYFGRKRFVPNHAETTAASFSMHSVSLGSSMILDATPCKELPLHVIIKSGRVGGLIMSSRTDPGTSVAGNIHLVSRLNGPRSSVPVQGFEGTSFESILMFFRMAVEGGKVMNWDYPWANAQSGLGLSPEQIEEAMRASTPAAIAEMEVQWRDRVQAHKKALLEKHPDYRDFEDDCGAQDTCSAPPAEGDGPRGRCTLVGDCCCAPDSVDCAREVDVHAVDPFTPSFPKPMNGYVWKEPSMISAEELVKVSFVATDAALQEHFSRALSEQGFAIVNGLREKFPDEFTKAITEVPELSVSHCKHPVFMYPATTINGLDAGKRRKLLGYIGDFENAPRVFMRLCMEHVAPGYSVALGKDTKGQDVHQCELIREILPPENEEGEVQCVHVDAAARVDCMAILRKNIQYVLKSKGPLSLFFPFEREYRLVVFPTAHKPAIECLKNFARHYEAAKAAFMKRKPKPLTAVWKAAWCGCIVNLLRKKFPGERFDPVCVRVDVGGMLAVSGFLPHCGLPVYGVRGFIAATYEVPLS